MSEKPLYYKRYTGNINYSSEDKCYYGQLQNINGLVDYCGEMLEELKTDFKVGPVCGSVPRADACRRITEKDARFEIYQVRKCRAFLQYISALRE